MLLKKTSYYLIAFCGILIGLYPSAYFIVSDRKFGLLASKSTELLADNLWNTMFYIHIVLGGIALFIGWLQFNKKFRNKYLKRHKNIGKIYIFSVLLSSISGLYIGYFATGGIIAKSGFMTMAIAWFLTTLFAFTSVKKGDIKKHQKLMTYSYAICFAAVTLRIYLPIFTPLFGGFLPAYKLIAWLCWLPNILVAYFINKQQFKTIN
ncbi:hypothetical protein BW723_00705 [Polaribacter reichenbachii]|uniref:DUF2306 domain-containing protein n=1 Tax=Polaribacter reichenbachii TaxID=996801 RepID=A0A1B8U4T4_9FLAO|nr:DUF2306 domain-containing protein [Polaribacter reichenbachii]APZ44893.1 hypothetical protein BW723_00705 [Polaribacter reichenbachii]AUC18757.1 hypothetical protein BTO17_08710 [Polaribacter reichenbachii]OBY66873.1 hypothetical protein LPB301_05450 [Polaribacter reichenbachii]